MESITAAEYADYPEVSAAQPTTQSASPPRRPSISQSEPSAVPVHSSDERGADNAAEQPSVRREGVIAVEEPLVVQEKPDSPDGQESPDDKTGTADSQKTPADKTESADAPEDDGLANEWHDILPQLKLTGMAQQLAEHCLFKSQADGKVVLMLDNSGETLKTTRTEEALREALGRYFPQPQQLEFEAVEVIGETPQKRRIRVNKERQLAAERAIAEDPVILELQQKWGGVVLPGSVKPNKDVDVF